MICILMNDSASSWIVANAIRQQFPTTVIVEDSESRVTFLKRRIKRLGLLKVIDQVIFVLFSALFSKSRVRQIITSSSFDMRKTACVRVSSVNDPITKKTVLDLNPQVVVVNGTRILSASLLSVLQMPVLNMHAGITPNYRGVHGGYWAMVEGEPLLAGVTIHLIDKGIDTGPILYQERIEVSHQDSFVSYPYLQLEKGLPLLLQAIRDAIDHRLTPRPSRGRSRLWTHPGFTEYVWNWLNRGVS